jgi:hypothetical protein
MRVVITSLTPKGTIDMLRAELRRRIAHMQTAQVTNARTVKQHRDYAARISELQILHDFFNNCEYRPESDPTD